MLSAIRPYQEFPLPLRLAGRGSDRPGRESRSAGDKPRTAEDLAYRVEIWSDDGAAVETTLAMTASGSIGYAAYYEAIKEYPDRHVTLRHKERVLARWNSPNH